MSDKKPIVKQFDAWRGVKSRLHFDTTKPRWYREREIWWMAIGHNIGVEVDGKGQMFCRPVLVLKGFSRRHVWGIPLTTTLRTGAYFYEFSIKGKVNNALLSQLRAYDTKRFISRLGIISERDYLNIVQSVIKILK